MGNTNGIVARLYFSHCSPSRLSLCKEAHVLDEAMRDIQSELQAWYDSSEGLNFSNGHHHLSLTLKVCYQYVSLLDSPSIKLISLVTI